MKLTISNKPSKPNPVELTRVHSMHFFGFDSNVNGLHIVFEKKDGGQVKYEIPDTSIGFAIDHLDDYTKVWFEYTSSEKNYEVELHFE